MNGEKNILLRQKWDIDEDGGVYSLLSAPLVGLETSIYVNS